VETFEEVDVAGRVTVAAGRVETFEEDTVVAGRVVVATGRVDVAVETVAVAGRAVVATGRVDVAVETVAVAGRATVLLLLEVIEAGRAEAFDEGTLELFEPGRKLLLLFDV